MLFIRYNFFIKFNYTIRVKIKIQIQRECGHESQIIIAEEIIKADNRIQYCNLFLDLNLN